MLTLHADSESRFERALEALENAYEIGGEPDPQPLIIDRIA